MSVDESNTENDTPPTFDALPLSRELRQAVDELGYVHPTPVQRAVFEPAAKGRDLVVQARTGTGKTAAFGMPIVDTLVRKATPAIQAVVLCPTRELALQVTREVTALAKHREVKTVAVYGGAPMARQVEQIQGGAQILVGTPGRVLDHLSRGTLKADAVRVLVLDESDEMLSMGFLPQINDIQRYLPETHQTLLFSATVPPDIRRLAETRLKDPEFITLSGDHIGALEIQHFVYITTGDKLNDLVQVLEIDNPESAIIFCNTRDETKRVAGELAAQGYSASWLNADLAQNDREKVMAATRSGNLRFLVATDVAARGIDISHLTHVINHDFPESTENYVHRTGRTGRAGRTGTAISLIQPSDIGNLYLLRLTYGIRPIEKQLPSARELRTRRETDLIDTFAELFGSRRQHAEDLALARRLLTHDRAEVIIAGLLRDHLGARPDADEEAAAARRTRAPRPAPEPQAAKPQAATPVAVAAPVAPAAPAPAAPAPAAPAAPAPAAAPSPAPPSRASASPAAEPLAEASADTEPRRRRRARGNGAPSADRSDVSPSERSGREPSSSERSDATRADAASGGEELGERPRLGPELAEIYINVGRRDGATATDFHTALADRGGVARDMTDYVRVLNRHTFVGLRRELLEQALDALNGASIAGKQALAEEARPRTDEGRKA